MLRDFMQTIREHIFLFDNYQEDIIIIEFDFKITHRLGRASLKLLNPFLPDAVMLIGVSEGEMQLRINYKLYSIGENSLVFINPMHLTHFVGVNEQFKGWFLAISKPYYTEAQSHFHQNKPHFISHLQLKNNPITVFDADEYRSIHASLNAIRNRMHQYAHLFTRDTIIHTFNLFILDVGSHYFGKQENHAFPVRSRKEELFDDFRTLLMQHFREEHEVQFYANKLCITTQYLSFILNEQSGISASRWIQDALMTEAKEKLKAPRTNIQQVADELHFPDQSTFGKFFKKHAGVSPLTFRKAE